MCVCDVRRPTPSSTAQNVRHLHAKMMVIRISWIKLELTEVQVRKEYGQTKQKQKQKTKTQTLSKRRKLTYREGLSCHWLSFELNPEALTLWFQRLRWSLLVKPGR